jgi:heme-degrading monooxygenase HmoA
MYLVHETLPITPGRQKAVEDRLASGHELMKQLPGFKEAQVCKYLGNTIQYLAIRRWENAAAFEGWGKSPQRDQYTSTRPPGLYTGSPVFLHLEEELETKGNAGGSFIALNYMDVDANRWPELVELRKRHDATAIGVGGVAYIRTYRDTEDASRAVSLWRVSGREAIERIGESAEMEAWRKTIPEGMMHITTRAFYEAVREH